MAVITGKYIPHDSVTTLQEKAGKTGLSSVYFQFLLRTVVRSLYITGNLPDIATAYAIPTVGATGLFRKKELLIKEIDAMALSAIVLTINNA
ncbi:MAG: hypothetical protein JXA71_16170 [Chitinispirillaceae bacterium]|nr:hypothetical protein [Chitinispirillaceae bacterium]